MIRNRVREGSHSGRDKSEEHNLPRDGHAKHGLTTTMERDEILAHLRERIVGFATYKVSRDVAEDLAQDVCMLLHQKYPDVSTLSDLLPLSLQILRFKMLDYQRKAFRRGEYTHTPIEEVPIPAHNDDPERELAKKQRMARLETALTKLPQRCQQLFRWKLEGKKFPEIRTLLNVRSINTVYTWDSRCRKQLMDLMGGSWE